MQHQLLVIQEEKVKTNDESNNNSVEISVYKGKVNPLRCCCKRENMNLSETNGIGQMLKDILSGHKYGKATIKIEVDLSE